ncbi:MAG: lipoate--protein ligase family protein [Bacteroidales bacterium]|nr:lipoate--protein ligase family protein [Bacteroidales bacterium]
MKNILIPDCGQKRLIFYLAMEDYVASKFDDEAFFVWQSEPTVIIGRNQILENEVNLDYCSGNGVQVYRRRSGGGCVYSDKGNVMISYISRRGDVASVFGRYLSELTDALCCLGLPAQRSERNDVLVAGRKVSGNAFHQLPDRSVVHGTLLYSTDLDALTDALRPPVEKLQRHGVESVRQRVCNLSGYQWGSDPVPEPLKSVEALMGFLTARFCDGQIVLSEEDVRKIEIIENEYLTLI